MSRSKGGDRERDQRGTTTHITPNSPSLSEVRAIAAPFLFSHRDSPRAPLFPTSIPTTAPAECATKSYVAASTLVVLPHPPFSSSSSAFSCYPLGAPLPPLSVLFPFLLPPLGYTQDTRALRVATSPAPSNQKPIIRLHVSLRRSIPILTARSK